MYINISLDNNWWWQTNYFQWICLGLFLFCFCYWDQLKIKSAFKNWTQWKLSLNIRTLIAQLNFNKYHYRFMNANNWFIVTMLQRNNLTTNIWSLNSENWIHHLFGAWKLIHNVNIKSVRIIHFNINKLNVVK
jgi:hypothetical protein